MISTVTRSLKKLRDEGWIAEKVEYWNSFARVRHDLFGFADIIAFRPGEVLLVQTTTASNVSARIKKIEASDTARAWLLAGFSVLVHGWHKHKNRWQCQDHPVKV